MSDKNGISVYILDREFKMACPRGKEQELRNAAHFLDTKMREIRNSGVVGIERIAILTALNFANELLTKPATSEDTATTHRIAALQERIDSVLRDAREYGSSETDNLVDLEETLILD